MRPLRLATVLVATDLDPASDSAVDTGRRLAAAAGAALHVVHVRELAPADEAAARPTGDPLERQVAAALHRAGASDRDAAIHVVSGPPPEAIRAVSEVIGADVIVLGPHRGGQSAASGPRLGGTARAVVAGAYAPCLVAVRPLRLPLARVLVPVDLSDTARGALLVALSWASALRGGAAANRPATLTALLVRDGEPGGGRAQADALRHQLDGLRRQAGDWAGVDAEGITAAGTERLAEVVGERARQLQADLVVVGTRGLGLDRVARLGSASAAIVEISDVPVLLVPPAVWRAHGAEPAPPLRQR